MKERNLVTIPRFYTVALYLCGLFLFLEWLYPIEQVTDTSSISIFVLYAVFCFFISVLQLKWWVSFLLKGFGLAFILNGLYFEMTFLSREWFNRLAMELMINIDILVSQNWYYLSPLFRSFLFLLLIWLMSYLLHYWFVQMKRIFLFIFLTFVYITVLDTFTMYDATFAIIRIFVISLVALAMSNFNRELERERLSFKRIKNKAPWSVPLILTIVFSVLIGIIAPKLDPIWPDPVPFIESAAEQVRGGSGEGTVRKVGYGEDDSQLGGSFIQDDTPVFTAEASRDQYWRIETKDIYTGKGWETSGEPLYRDHSYHDFVIGAFHPEVETEELTARITFQEGQNFSKLVYPYGIKRVTDISHDVVLRVDYLTESIEARSNGEQTKLDYYELIYEHPSFSLTALREEADETFDISHYLQLPDSLPTRVQDLALEITSEYDNQYDKARAIERYFSSNDFTYETTGVAIPGPDEDYVDQFLFETQMGYCDNFSTAMVVMLRSIDIPARWVKGFTGGEVIGEGSNEGYNLYQVTNANAHSWVEVYFQEIGWVTFEPTQGFSNLTDFHVESSETDYQEYDDVLEVPQQDLPENDVETEEDEAEPVMGQGDSGDVEFSWVQLGIIVLIILGIVFIMYKQRLKIKTKLHEFKLGKNRDEKSFQDAYLHLLTVLEHKGYGRKEDQTLREFAKRVDARYLTGEMQVLTAHYEQLLYRDDFDSTDLDKLIGLWKKLIKAVSAN